MTKPYVIAYARTSTRAQSLDIQLDALGRAGFDRLFTEQESGAKRDRRELAAALSTLRPGDVLQVWKLDRLARSVAHLSEIMEDLLARGIGFRSLTEGFDTTTPAGKMIFHVIGSMAEFERSLIQERREAGLAKARAAGKKFGRRSAADPTATRMTAEGQRVTDDKSGRLAKAMQAVARGSTVAGAARDHNLSRSTLTRHIGAEQRVSNIVSLQPILDIVSLQKRAAIGDIPA